MNECNLFLSNDQYTLGNALLWGNFKSHAKKAQEGGKCWYIHGLIATIEFFPVLSQIASLVEMLAAKIFKPTEIENNIRLVLPNPHEMESPKIQTRYPLTVPARLFQTQILSRLDNKDLSNLALTRKEMNYHASVALDKEMDSRIAKATIGPDKWKKHIGHVEDARPMPEAMKTFMKSDCPYHPGKKVFQTHTALWIPKIINGEPLTVNTIGKRVKATKNGGNNSCYGYIWDQISNNSIANNSVEESCWILMTNDVIEESRNKSFEEQKNLIKSDMGYEVPSTLEAIVSVFMTYICSGEEKVCRYGRDPWTSTRCKEKIGAYQVIVGGFGPSGLRVYGNDSDYDIVGVGALRKF